ncbi:MAG TPA: hypothetical protein VN132_00640, partial [Bdellovibrio sp.]|nr:hypothetical protein [Bdellovibrio sp.]
MRTFIISSLAIPLFMFAISQKSQAVEPSQEEQMAFLEQSLNEIQTNWTKQIEDKLKKNPVDIQPDGDYVGFYSLEQK